MFRAILAQSRSNAFDRLFIPRDGVRRVPRTSWVWRSTLASTFRRRVDETARVEATLAVAPIGALGIETRCRPEGADHTWMPIDSPIFCRDCGASFSNWRRRLDALSEPTAA